MTTLDIKKAAIRLAYQTQDSGGGSVSLVCGIPSPTNGYMVALPGREESFLAWAEGMNARPVEHSRILAETYAETHKAILAQPAHYLGSWVDGDRVVFDVSVNVFEFAQAVELGWTTGQDAIYDLEAGRDILTRPGRRTTIFEDQQRADTLAEEKFLVHKWLMVRSGAPEELSNAMASLALTQVGQDVLAGQLEEG